MGDPAPQEVAPALQPPPQPLPGETITPPPQPAPPPKPVFWQLEFTADHREYFRIWIVNTFLTLATLGVYAAWAKVRKRRYFYGHTRLLGHAFDYTADPKKLLAGNAIVFVLFLGYAFFGAAYPVVKFLTLVFAAPVLPWLIIRALSFNARNTVHRGLSFRYRPYYPGAFLNFVVLPLLCLVTLGGLYPYFSYKRKQFAIDRLRFGDGVFHFDGKVSTFYGFYLVGVLPFIAWFIALSAILGIIAINTGQSRADFDENWLMLGSAVSISVFWLSRMIVRVKKFNHVWNNTWLDGHRFHARMALGTYLKIQLTNAAAVIGTLGLAFPWASVRLARYTLSCLEIWPDGNLDKIEQLGTNKGAALGDAATDFLGFDIGL